MRVKIFRKDPSVILPAYHTSGSVAFDLAANEDMVIPPREIRLIPTGLVICTPENHMLLVAARSSTPMKKGLMLANGIGIVDQDFCGPDDEIKIQVYNFTDKPVEVKKGDRLAQGLFLHLERVEWEEITSLPEKSRGGFGSTG
ncbi:dUTPase [Candidatus Uhrbacteria bacterium RIFCSPLOWO2_01_FULL_47_24]|uniref:dUTP diphosphatase n=1 Tax=Candidatus Uhrbacteria bacterium RIFCSPLOWO2_01_FULL_47_24 TaxID=1802401 RepID=A0A1F7UQY5_9BACT|nr:MAG: dUTPase [Candidatus Uhrbacteria bacterium RIFCSPHIGHO2_02_FULL_46_47]OGL75193.1 MAG: dUTPase [Candidatus Uhrbacteria bacterium RIFCSPHIGHO2_12_FULL_47_11]OGL80108.1 MAG: dUTPase [Candidatus Uhrbacteria bacterium RIFCSPLOWO2_01_FULL_47_24]OGL84894.1 MAG: dUTPase [Candidatus Uhrbacteria bacterium RIFCSPLOWO2_02_FULL_46_25]OGL92446.1 MAG: dUTPase [Candidatus Uhrbacteria bacterium RIFCSPLOWO2_12_FULL_47_10]